MQKVLSNLVKSSLKLSETKKITNLMVAADRGLKLKTTNKKSLLKTLK